MAGLTEKQKRFADYFIELGNATEAARRAGYSQKYTNTNANKLLQNTTIKDYIDERLEKLEEDRIAKATEVMKYLTSVMRGEKTEQVVIVEGDGDGYSSAKIIDKEVGARDRLKAAELIGKRYGIFTEKMNIEGVIPIVIKDDISE